MLQPAECVGGLDVSLGVVIHVNLSLPGQYGVGGTVLAQCYSQLSVWVVWVCL